MITGLLSNLGQLALNLMERAGYGGILAIAFLDRAAMNWVPAEIVFPLVGAAVSQTLFSFWPVMAVITLGSLLGDGLIYFLSRKWGRALVEKYGKFFFLSAHELEHSDRLFQRHGGKLVFFGRFMPIVRAFVAIPAGLSRMPLKRFLLYSALGSLPGNLPLVYVGQKAGENWNRFAPYLRFLDLIVLGVAGFLIVWYISRHKAGRKIKP